MTRFIWLYILVFIFIPIISVSGKNADEASSVIRVENNLLTVNVKDIPFKKVLKEISNQTQIKFILYTPAEEPLLANFSQLPMEKGLKRLLVDYNYSIISGSEALNEGGHNIKQVFIVSKEGKSHHGNAKTIIVSTETSEPESMSDEILYEMERKEMERRRRFDDEEVEDEYKTTVASFNNDWGNNASGTFQAPEEELTDEEQDERELRERERRDRLDEEEFTNETTASSFSNNWSMNVGGRLSNEDALRITGGGMSLRPDPIITDETNEEREERERRKSFDEEDDE